MGFSSGSSSSDSQSYGYGYNLSDAVSSGESTQSIYGPQAQGLNQMYAQGGTALSRANNSGFANSMANNARGDIRGNNMNQAAMNQIAQGRGPMDQFTNPNNALVQRQLGDLGREMGDFFNEQLMPGIQGNAVAMGGLGGGRNQVAQAQAAGQVADAYSSGATGIMSNAYNQAQNASAIQAQNMMGAAGMSNDLAMANQNLGMAGLNSFFAPLQAYQGLLGAPTVLGNSFNQSQASQTSENITSATASSKSSNFGMSFI